MRLFYSAEKQSPGGVLWKRCSWNFCKLHSKTPVLGLFFKLKQGWLLQTFFIKKKIRTHVFLCSFCESLKETLSQITPWYCCCLENNHSENCVCWRPSCSETIKMCVCKITMRLLTHAFSKEFSKMFRNSKILCDFSNFQQKLWLSQAATGGVL